MKYNLPMDIKHIEIEYNKKAPFHAEICSIERMAPHYHNTSLEILFCLEGSVSFVAGTQKETISEGQVFSIDREVIHYLYSDVPNKVLIFHLDLTGMSRPWEELCYIMFTCESEHCFSYQLDPLKKVKDLILALSLEFFNGCVHPEESSIAADTLVELLLRYFNYYNYYNPDDYIDKALWQRAYNILRYCFENYNRKITASDVAEFAHISRSYLSQYLRNTPFLSFSNILKYARCFRAEHLLLSTNMSNSEIAFACGFSDSKYLYSAFNQLWGCSPYTHRKNYRTYMNQQESYSALDAEDAADRVCRYIIDWHIDKFILDM